MCHRAGSAVAVLGAALDANTASADDEKSPARSAAGGVLCGEVGGVKVGGVSRRMSGSEPLRSELLALQLSECATEMEDDLRVHVRKCGKSPDS